MIGRKIIVQEIIRIRTIADGFAGVLSVKPGFTSVLTDEVAAIRVEE